MKWWDKTKKWFMNETVSLNDQLFMDWFGGVEKRPLMSEPTYFACMKIMSESMGKLPLKMYQSTENGIIKSDKSDLYNILKLRPNPYMSSSTFWATVEMNRNHYGNGYVWNRYKGLELQDMWIMPSKDVTVIVDNGGLFGTKDKLWYKYQDPQTGKTYTINGDNVMHFKTSTTFDGITGIPIRETLKTTVNGALESQKFMNSLYETGLTGKAVLEYTGDLDAAAKTRLVKGFEDFANGSKNAGKIIPVPLGMKLVPLDIKLTDSQFFELKKYTALQISAAFGVKPNQINDYEKSSYASAEAQNLAFYTDTLLYVLTQYEQEITYKVLSKGLVKDGHYFKFNVNVILRADMKTQMETLVQGVQNGIYSPNDARSYLDMPMDEFGGQLMANGNYMPLSMVGKSYAPPQPNSSTDNPTDE